jgi:catechol 2,3-dioxygenase-like lactoylglutathione lyase family enzyme
MNERPPPPVVVDHIDLRVRDLAAARSFFEQVLAPLGFSVVNTDPTEPWVSFGVKGHDDFGLCENPEPTRNLHIAFTAHSTEAVDRFHAVAIALGAKDNGAPGYRPQYHPGYYGAFVLDAEGNNLEAVFHQRPPSSAA